MSATYSINIGLSIESTRKQDVYAILQDLPDNTSKLISPRDVRDAVLTTWANSSFRQTSGTASIEYIGVDSGDPSNRDIKQKIFLGKRNIAGVDVMNNSLLSDPNSDIFFYNTKSDSSLTHSYTRIAILSGTDSNLYEQAVYFQSIATGGTGPGYNIFEFVNPSIYGGPINLYSDTGRISLNGIIFPTIAESSASASNGKILRYKGTYPNGSLVWDDANVTLASIGSTGSPTTIIGSVSLNGYPLELTDSTPVPQAVGGITMGTTFSAIPLVEVIREILYPYIEPSLFLSSTNTVTGTTYSEVGVTSSSSVFYSITRTSNDIATYSVSGTTYSGLSFSALPGDIVSATISSPTYSISVSTKSWILTAVDDTTLSYTLTASINFIYPVMYGFTSSLVSSFSDATLVSSYLGRSIVPQPPVSESIILNYDGDGYFYWVIHNTYSDPKYIKDPNGFIIHDYTNWSSSAFTYSVLSPSILPTGGGSTYSTSFKFWRTIATCSYPGGNFEFIF